jgi:hypothetical protein
MDQYFSDFHNFIRTTTTITTGAIIIIIIIIIIAQKLCKFCLICPIIPDELTNGLINHTICQQW